VKEIRLSIFFFFKKLYKKLKPDQAVPEEFGRDREWNVDLIPKFMMASGEIVRFLTHTDVTRYLEFKQVSGSYVYRGDSILKVPSNASEALASPLMGLLEKNRMKKFLEWVQNYNLDDPSTHEGNLFSCMEIQFILTCLNRFGCYKGYHDRLL
jgi:Rab GDP dissociation inhibitor